MSFICTICGPVQHGEQKHSIPIKIRDVEYQLQVKNKYHDGEALKTIKKSYGTEIIKEASYCKKHLPKDLVMEKGKHVTRTQLVKTTFKRMDKNKDEEV